jgi:hypothetical protein
MPIIQCDIFCAVMHDLCEGHSLFRVRDLHDLIRVFSSNRCSSCLLMIRIDKKLVCDVWSSHLQDQSLVIGVVLHTHSYFGCFLA